MASSQLSIIFAIIAIFVPLVLAKEYVVGDTDGWTIGIDYDSWAKGKQFAVGDTLVFKYKEGAHNVIEVKEDEYQQCNPSPTAKALTTGNDVVKLDAPGKRYFICGIGKHCAMGKQKIAIDVGSSSSSTGPSASSPTESSKGASSPTESGSSDSTATKSGSSDSTATKSGADGSSESQHTAPAPAPSNAVTIGQSYVWMVIISSIIGFFMA
ncbi:blue copper protein 1b-like [Argentina anserina]|uniref:blue copper protein 1b-like n=1 Tax=Argentina anserina TaxID=57926 RepID=UPI0021765D5D|nr:blue copper protein 1b-like [Potentilla anserina]